MGVPVYHLYRMRATPENEPIMNQSHEYICSNNRHIQEDMYEMVYDQGLLTDGMTITEVQAKLKAKPPEYMKGHSLSTGDVIVLKRGDSISCFFCDTSSMVQIQGFFEQAAPQVSMPLTPMTTDYQIAGADGLWDVTDTITVDDEMFYVLENGLPESVTFKYILDQNGKVVTNCARNEADAIARIRAFMEKPTEEHKPVGEEKAEKSVSCSDETAMNQIRTHTENKDGTAESGDVGKRVSVRKRLQEKKELLKNRQHGIIGV